jgi:hypothetical protein
MKQTAVEWLVEKLNQCEPMYSGVQSNEHKEYLEKLVEQAKEIEKEQIIKAYDESNKRLCLQCTDFKTGIKYYNETFKNKTK